MTMLKTAARETTKYWLAVFHHTVSSFERELTVVVDFVGSKIVGGQSERTLFR